MARTHKTTVTHDGITKVCYLKAVELDVLVRCYYQAGVRLSSPAEQRIAKKLRELDLIEDNGEKGKLLEHTTTERGSVHIQALCAVPLPEKKWVPAVPYEFKEGE